MIKLVMGKILLIRKKHSIQKIIQDRILFDLSVNYRSLQVKEFVLYNFECTLEPVRIV